MDTSRVRSRVRTRTHGAVGRRRLRPPLTRYKIKGHPTRRQVIWSQCSDPLLGRDEVTRTNRGAEGIGGRVKFLPLAWAGMPKTSFRKNSDSPQ
jgi:hypothetical protein